MENIKFIEHKKIRICCDKEKQSIELGRESIKHGFLKTLPGPSLPVFIYILTHIDTNQSIRTNPAIMAGFLALDREDIKKGLNILKKHGYINLNKEKKGNYTCEIKVNLNKIVGTCFNNNENNSKENLDTYRTKVLKKNNLSENDYIKALISFLPDGIDHTLIEEEIEHWIKDFDKKMLKELIRRVDKWINKNNKNKKEGFYYLHGIIDDWYNKKIFDYDRLKYFDRMYRETNELANCYGLKNWFNVSETQMEIFSEWLNENNGLSLSIAKYAIKEAFRRKSDGQPSLKYIEDNLIKPLKENDVKSIEQARKTLNNNSTQKNEKNTKTKNKKSKDNTNWETFEWDIEDLN